MPNKLKPGEGGIIATVIRDLVILEDHCERAQKYFEDYLSSRGPITKIKHSLLGNPKKYHGPLCGECFDIQAELMFLPKLQIFFNLTKEVLKGFKNIV
jgi:hypothetical protein